MREDKQDICNALLLALKKTKDLYDLVELNYYINGDGDEIVVAKFQNGHEKKSLCQHGQRYRNDIGYSDTTFLKRR